MAVLIKDLPELRALSIGSLSKNYIVINPPFFKESRKVSLLELRRILLVKQEQDNG